MTEFFAEYGLFLAKTATVVAAVLIVMAASVVLSKKAKSPEKLEVTDLNDKYDAMAAAMQSHILPKKEQKRLAKEKKTEKKARKKESGDEAAERMFVINFHGDIKATSVASLREEITAVLSLASDRDEVLVRLENTGGIVHEHGLGASQLQRLKDAGIPITVSVDKVAASGGYMMACVAQKIIAAPFAVLGSIGVLAQIPNFHEMLSRQGIKFEQETAGEYKRTLTMFGENTEKEREKLREQIEDTHILFKEFVAHNRPDLDMAEVATGEHWYGTRAMELGLVDDITTSDDYLLAASKHKRLYEITYTSKKSVAARLLSSIQLAFGRPANSRFDSHYL